jgi:hypothetical protein
VQDLEFKSQYRQKPKENKRADNHELPDK